MLPRFKSIDILFEKAERRFVQQTVRGDGILQRIDGHIIHEGKRTAIRRPDDSLDETDIVSHGAEIKFGYEEIEGIDLPIVLEKLRSMAEQFKTHRVRYLAETLNAVTQKTGNIHDAKGRPLTVEDIFSMLEKVEINFERNELSGDMTIWASSQMEPVFQRLQREFDASPELQKRWNELMDKKRNDYRAREADRNLAG